MGWPVARRRADWLWCNPDQMPVNRKAQARQHYRKFRKTTWPACMLLDCEVKTEYPEEMHVTRRKQGNATERERGGRS